METYNLEFLNKYKELIRYRWNNPITKGIYEKHHIIPKSICKNKIWVNSSTNLINLTPKEHFYAHYYLWKSFPENHCISVAAFLMCYGKRPFNRQIMDEIDLEYKSNEYEKLRLAYINSMNVKRSEIVKKMLKTKEDNGTLHQPSWNKGKKGTNHHTDEFKKEMSKRLKNWKNNPFRKPLSEESKQKRLQTLKLNGKLKLPRNNKGYRTIYKDNIVKQVRNEIELNEHLISGWKLGNIKTKNIPAWNKGKKTSLESIEKFKKSFGKRHWYHNDKLKLCKTYKENEQPEGFILGRVNYT